MKGSKPLVGGSAKLNAACASARNKVCPARKRRRPEGVSAIEVCLVLSVLGCLLSAFLPSFIEKFQRSPVEQAVAQLDRLHALSAHYFRQERRYRQGSSEQGGLARRCLPPAAGPTPARATKEPSSTPAAVFHRSGLDGAATWKALGFAPERPIRFRYSFLPTESGCHLNKIAGKPLLRLRAEGDLNGDGVYSLIERAADVTAAGELVPVGALVLRNVVE